MGSSFTSTSSAPENAPGWGHFRPGESVTSISELHEGDLVLERTRKHGFRLPRYHVIKILGGDPTGKRALVRGRFVEPEDPTQRRADSPPWVVLWDFYLTEGVTEIYRPASA